jgi:hypothetical protein
MPQVFADQGSTVSNGASGTATVSLRNLGPTAPSCSSTASGCPRGSPTYYATDLNAIPAPLIQRIEILTGGASAIYGSDAVAGVVNFIMRKDFQGVPGRHQLRLLQPPAGQLRCRAIVAAGAPRPTRASSRCRATSPPMARAPM